MLTLLLGLSASAVATEPVTKQIKPPIGVRPCCAFGVDLKAKVGVVPVPWFSLSNVVQADSIGNHRYNDGSVFWGKSLVGMADESNGLLFTEKAGFIDIAHVRDTADYTYFLYQLNLQHLGQAQRYQLPAELRLRQIRWQPQPQQLTTEERQRYSIDAAALIAFQLAQWHEIAQWFGLVSVSGFKEYASAFSNEDLYSNMLGATLAKRVISDAPNLDPVQFGLALDQVLAVQLKQLKAQPKAVTKSKIEQLDGKWWDSSKRLPDKWAVRFRDYRMALTLTPNYPGATAALTLPHKFENGESMTNWVSLALLADDYESKFSALPESLTQQPVWTAAQFQAIADFAERADNNSAP